MVAHSGHRHELGHRRLDRGPAAARSVGSGLESAGLQEFGLRKL